eukprot:500725-Pleurochrysis_carterae.AAC.1
MPASAYIVAFGAGEINASLWLLQRKIASERTADRSETPVRLDEMTVGELPPEVSESLLKSMMSVRALGALRDVGASARENWGFGM